MGMQSTIPTHPPSFPKTPVRIPVVSGTYEGNVFGLVFAALEALRRGGYTSDANELSMRIRVQATSPTDVRRIIREYVTIG